LAGFTWASRSPGNLGAVLIDRLVDPGPTLHEGRLAALITAKKAVRALNHGNLTVGGRRGSNNWFDDPEGFMAR